MLRTRFISALLLGLPVLGIIVLGGAAYAALVLIIFSICLIEFNHLVARRGHRAFGALMVLWLLLFWVSRLWPEFPYSGALAALLLVGTMGWAIVRFRQGTANAFTGFAMTIAGAFYIGWPGAHFVSMRFMEDGLFWTLTLLVAVWSADTFAYLIGSAFGRRRLLPDISPGKTWEGYLGGVVLGTLLTGAAMLGWRALGAGPSFNWLNGMAVGFLISSIAPLGDFAISMLKRYVGAKHASNLIPGHGGLLDRTDALIIGGLILYYYATLVAF